MPNQPIGNASGNLGEKLQALRDLIQENDLNTRNEDYFLERFLKLRRYDVDKAFAKLKNYENFKAENNYAFCTIKKGILKKAVDLKMIDMLEGNDAGGKKIIWMRVGMWDPSVLSADELLQIPGLMADVLLATNKDEMLAANIIYDMQDFGMKQVQGVSAKFAKKMVYYLSECIPVYIHSIYIVREPMIFSIIFALFKPFLSAAMNKHIKFFGNNLEGLQQVVNPKILPPELGGTNTCVNIDRWSKLLERVDVLEELAKSGYKFIED